MAVGIPDARPGPRAGLGRLAALAAYWLGLSALWGAISTIVLPRLVEQVVPAAVKTTALAAVAGLQAIVSIVVQPAAGAASDRAATPWGRRRPFMAVGVAAQLVLLGCLLLVHAYWAIVVVLLLVEVASNAAQGPYQGLLPDVVPAGERAVASGLLGAAQLAGQVAGVAIAGVLIAGGDVHGAIVFSGGAVALGALVTLLGVKEARPAGWRAGPADWLRSVFQPRGWAEPVRTVLVDVWGRDVLERRDYLRLLASRLAILMATGTLQPFIFYYLEDSLGLGDGAGPAVAPVAAVVAFVALASAVPGGILAGRWGRVRVVSASAAVGAVGAVAFACAPSYGWLFPIAVPFGIALGVFLSADWALLVELVPPDQAGRYLGLSNTATAGAGLLAVAIGGPLADLVNAASPGLGYRAVFALAAVEFLVGAVLVRRVREPRVARGSAPATA